MEAWFRQRIGEATDVQAQAWPALSRGDHALIAAPTGSGKTLAAVLPCLDRLARVKLAGAGEEGPARGVQVLYVTPLKALNNDIHHHLARFLRELAETAAELEQPWPELSVGVRTADTSQSTRASMLRRPPDLLVTTPESLFLLLTSEKARTLLRTVRQVIVDEIHDLASDKRGMHLTVSLERLEELCGRPVQRIGVSATQKPIDRMARFLGGWESSRTLPAEEAGGVGPGPDRRIDGVEAGEAPGAGYSPRAVTIIESPMERELALLVTMVERAGKGRGEERIWQPLLDKLFGLMEGSVSCIIFANNRRLCERLTLRLNEHAGEEIARSHHGSVSREKRLEVERQLKAGELRCLVATSTLELGIDIGAVDLVLQIDSPKSAAAAIQRFGRAGHAVGGVSRGVMVARSRGELPEAAVLARAAAARAIEPIHVPPGSLDVLSQQLVAMAATDDWPIERLAAVLARSDSFRELTLTQLTAALEVLGGLFPFIRPLLDWDRERGVVRRRPGSSMAAVLGAGTIPPTSSYPVHHAESRVHVGELDEEYILESRVGDVFQLGASSWQIREIRPDRVYVTEAANRFGEIPFWRAQPISRSEQLGREVGRFLERLSLCDLAHPQPVQEWLKREYKLDESASLALIGLVKTQRQSCAVPTDQRLVLEHYPDDNGRHHLIIHSLFGRRFNLTWQLALKAELERVTTEKVYAGVRDGGIEFVFSKWDPSYLEAIARVDSSRLEELVLDSLPGSALFGRHFRRMAEVSLLLVRGYTRVPAWKQRMRSEELLREALAYSERFPYVRESLEEAMRESLSVPEVKRMLDELAAGQIEVIYRDTLVPSPFGMEFVSDYIMANFYESDAVSGELQRQVLGVSRELAADLFGEDAARQAISPEVLEREAERLFGKVKQPLSPDEAYRLLKERGDHSPAEYSRVGGAEADERVAELCAAGKVVRIPIAGEERYICSDEAELYRAFPVSREAVAFILRRYLEHRLSFTAEELASRYGVSLAQSREWIAEWSREQRIEPAPFAEPEETGLWTSAKVAERVIRFSLLDYRRQAEPVEPSRYAAYLAQLQGVSGGSLEAGASAGRLTETGPDALRQVIAGLQGWFLPASHYETHLFPARLAGYRQEDLDLLCASGDVVWLGRRAEGEKEGRIAFFLTESADLLAPCLPISGASAQPELLAYLQERGACFLAQIARDFGELPSVMLARLLDLVWEGRVANDQFAPLRMAVAGGAAVRAKGSGRKGAFQSGLGRWYAVAVSSGPISAARGSDGLPDRESSSRVADRAAAAWVRHLLDRFGLVTRQLVAEVSPYSWDQLYGVLRQLEEWGLVTRGFFVAGIPVMQYAVKETVDALRGYRPFVSGERTLLSAADPANPYGVLLPWPEREAASFSRKPSQFLLLHGTTWQLWLENNGKRLVDLALPSEPKLRRASLLFALRAVMKRAKLKKVAVERFNGEPIRLSPEAARLALLGAEWDRETMVFWPSVLAVQSP
jgi:ATP-dependent Lhr-like helicase